MAVNNPKIFWTLGVLVVGIVLFGCSDSTTDASSQGGEEEADTSLLDDQGIAGENEGGSNTPTERIVVLPTQDDFGDPCDSNDDCESGFCVVV